MYEGVGRVETTLASGGVPSASSRRFLLVVGAGHVGTYPLPDGRALVLGRDPSCEVPLAHPKISRRHARVVAGPTVAVEDLGSTNGIRVGGTRIAGGGTATLRTGESFELGPFVGVILEAPREATDDAPLLAAIPISDPTPAGVPEVVTRVAQGGVNVLITGETGVGKEVLARTLHELSGRAGPFVPINCAALSEPLLESELFGHERGAFTGATAAKQGLFEVGTGGTVLLDEIGDLPASLQAKLLRALETRQVYRLGGVKPVSLDVRFISATHRDLGELVAQGSFRRDLYFRVNGITLAIAPLRERRDAIPALAMGLLRDAAAAAGRTAPRLAATGLAALVRHDWPGNVRELKTVLERALMVSSDDEIRAGHILFDRLPAADHADAESRLVAAAATHRGNVSAIARALGTSRSQVRRLAERYGIALQKYR